MQSMGLLGAVPQKYMPAQIVQASQLGVTEGALVHSLLAAVHVFLVPRQRFDAQVCEAVRAGGCLGFSAAVGTVAGGPGPGVSLFFLHHSWNREKEARAAGHPRSKHRSSCMV